jgi:hypothetical protein
MVYHHTNFIIFLSTHYSKGRKVSVVVYYVYVWIIKKGTGRTAKTNDPGENPGFFR